MIFSYYFSLLSPLLHPFITSYPTKSNRVKTFPETCFFRLRRPWRAFCLEYGKHTVFFVNFVPSGPERGAASKTGIPTALNQDEDNPEGGMAASS
jgi:hypothetical protein